MTLKPLPISANLRSLCVGASLLTAALLLNTTTAQGQGCQVYPIALSLQTLATAAPGNVLTNIWNGDQPGNFGWLSWTDDPGEPTLVTSLTPPGDSATYVNPDDPNDHQLAVGKWVSGKPGVSNGKHVRAALNTLLNVQIIVPVWDAVRGQGDTAAYRIAGFAAVEILNYQLPSRNQITARFDGFVSCGNETTFLPLPLNPAFELAAR
jgi:hypothetical protein